MKSIRSLTRVLLLAASLLTFSLGVEAHPYASGVTNDNGTIRFIMNEAGADVNVVFENNATIAMGVLPKGPTNFPLGFHTSYQIICSKLGNGTASLISSDAYTNSVWASPRGVGVNQNPKIGNLFGRIYVGSSAAGGTVGTTFKGKGLYALNADQTDAIGQGTNAAAASSFGTGDGTGIAGTGPWRLRVAPDNTVVVCDSSVIGAAIYQFAPDFSSSNLVLAGIGRAAGQAAGVHGDFFGTPLITGSLAEGNLVLWTADGQLAAPAGATLGPGTSVGSFNCIFRYDIGSGPLPWNHAPNYAYTEGLDGIPGLRPEMTLGKDGKIIAGFGRANLSNPNIQILDPTGATWLYTSGVTPPANTPPASDPWNGLVGNNSQVGTYCGVRVSPDGRFLASVDINNAITLGNLTNGIPDDASLVGIANTPAVGNSRGMDWDAANNLYVISSGQGFLRIYSLGLTTTCITSNDFTGANGSFQLILPSVTASVVATTPVASQNYGTPVPGVFRINLSTNFLTAPVTIGFTRSGTATYTNFYTINTNETPNGVTVGVNSVTFPAGIFLGSNGPNWNVDVKIVPTALPVSTNTLTVSLQVLGGAANVAGAPARDTVFIQNTGPQLLLLTASPTTTILFPAATMYRGVTNDYARFVITRLGDTNGPGNSSGSVTPRSYTVTNVTYFGTAVFPSDYGARAQRIDPAGNGVIVPPVDGPTAITILPGDTTVTCVIGNPKPHANLSAIPVDTTIIVNLTNAVACPACTNLASAENYPYSVGTVTTTLTVIDNAVGPEVVLWSNPLTNVTDAANWTLTYADTKTGGSTSAALPVVIPSYTNGLYSTVVFGTNDFDVRFGYPASADAVSPSPVMAANGWNNVLKMTANKTGFAQAGVNVYPRGQNFFGNYALRFNMYLSLYQFALNNPNIGSAGREFALFGINHRGTNCNWRTVAAIPAGAGNSPTNSDGQWFAIDAGSGSITPADFDAFVPGPVPNNANGPAAGFLPDKVSNSAASQNGVFKHPPFDAMNVTSPRVANPGGGEPVNKWVDVSVEITKQTNVSLFINRSPVLTAFSLTNAAGPGLTGSYTNGTIMLGYNDPVGDVSDDTAFVFFSNVRVVELSPYILVQPGLTNSLAPRVMVPQFSSLTFTSAASFATAPITNVWYRGTVAAPGTVNTGVPTVALQTNSVNATNMTDTLTQTFNSGVDATNYMSVFSDAAGSVTSTVVQVEVILGPTNRVFNAGTTSNLLIVAAGPLAPVTNQWYFNTVSNFSTATKLVNSSHLAGVSTNSLIITNIVASDAGYYWAAATNAAGFVIPQAATLTVNGPASATPPTFTNISLVSTNVVMGFTTTNVNDTASSFTLQSSPVVQGPYTNTPASFTGSGGTFQVTVPQTAANMFYRLLHN